MPTGANNLFFSMQCIDGCVFPFPVGSFSVNRAINELKNLGYTGLVACGLEKEIVPEQSGFSIFKGRYIRLPGIREIQKEIQIASREGSLCIVRAGEGGVNRSILTSSGVHVLSDLHNAPKNAFDRVCAQYAADHGVAIDIRITPLRELRGTPRERVIREYEEILLLQNRYEFPLIISSGAMSPFDLRSPRAIEALLIGIGMEKDLIQDSFTTIPRLLEGNKPVQRIN
ncbi:MAG: RNase P subunit p30 family protein [Methanobacteriota archaeon]